MAAAVALAGRGIPVTVYESARHLGGRARAVAYKNGTLDNGQHLLIGAYRETLRLIEMVGLSPAQLWRVPLTWHIVDGLSFRAAEASAPWHLVLGLARSSGWSIGARVECVRFLNAWRRRRFVLERDTTVEQLLRVYGQSVAVTRMLWEPLCIAALNTRPERASARVFLNVLRDTLASDAGASDMILPRCDLGALFPEPAFRYVHALGGRVALGESILRIDVQDGGFALAAPSSRRTHRAVIVAAQPSRVARLVGHLQPMAHVAAQIRAMTFEPIVTVYLKYARPPRMPFPMVGFAQAHTQWLFDRGAIGGEAGLVAAVISARERQPSIAHADLAHRVHLEIASAFAPIDSPQWTQVVEEKRATIACVPDLERPDQRTPIPGLFLAGDYTRSDYPATLESAVRSGLRCAELAHDHLAQG